MPKKKTSRAKARPPRLETIAFVVKHRQPEATRLAIELALYCLKKERTVLIADESAAVTEGIRTKLGPEKCKDLPLKVIPKPKLVDRADLIIVLGGDGTFLSIARLMRSRSIPVLGVNMGQLGFLTEVKRDEALERLSGLLAGRSPVISERALLEVTLKRNGKTVFQGPVVNDAVISKGAIARIIGLQISVNGQWAHTVRADGIIISTPTGSTAYSLAAGGPIVEPSVPALVMAPICPHSLTQRPLVIRDDSEIEIQLNDRPGHVLLTLDGQDAFDMKEGDVVHIRRFRKHALKLISSPTRDYFGLLREKLKFGMRD